MEIWTKWDQNGTKIGRKFRRGKSGQKLDENLTKFSLSEIWTKIGRKLDENGTKIGPKYGRKSDENWTKIGRELDENLDEYWTKIGRELDENWKSERKSRLFRKLLHNAALGAWHIVLSVRPSRPRCRRIVYRVYKPTAQWACVRFFFFSFFMFHWSLV